MYIQTNIKIMPLLSELVNDINAEQDALMLKDRMKAFALQYCEALAAVSYTHLTLPTTPYV